MAIFVSLSFWRIKLKYYFSFEWPKSAFNGPVQIAD